MSENVGKQENLRFDGVKFFSVNCESNIKDHFGLV